MFGLKDIASYPEETEANEDGMNAEDYGRELASAIFTEESSGEGNEGDEEEEEGVDIRQVGINIFRIHRNEEMVRSPVGK